MYLTNLEKVRLCATSPPNRATEPVRCLQVAESSSRAFAHAPRRALGLFMSNLLLPEERLARELLIAMC
jgi:hypothetical protein